MKKFILLLITIVAQLSPLQSFSQQTSKIIGVVKDDKQSIPSATILLYAVKDSSLVASAMTDTDGKFTIAAKQGTYYIVSSSIGYNKVKTNNFRMIESVFQVPVIILTESSGNLKEVSITSSKPVLERINDKLIFNIDATPSASGLNALEVLKKAPGVTVDYNENISLAGKSNVLVTLDGKQTYLSGTEVVNLLKSMQSSDIESVEIINNPGSRYEANSTGGIINIKTKKSKSEGFNGNLALGGGFNKYVSTNNDVNLNYRKKAFNIFGSYGYNSRKYEEKLMINRVTPGLSDELYFSQRNKDTSNNMAHNFKAGTDFFLSQRHTIGILFKGNINDYKQKGLSNIEIGDLPGTIDSILITPSTDQSNRKNYTYNINYKGILDTLGQELTVDADYSTFDGSTDAGSLNRFYLADGRFFKNGQIYRNFSPSSIDIKAVKADYTLPFNRKVKLDAGFKIANVKSDNNYVYENNINGLWLFDDTKSNHFKYEEQVNAVYATLNLTLGKSTLQAGLRAENTKSTGNSITTNQITKRKYTDLFPALMFTRNIDADNILNLSYSRKINRPNYQNLNPFVYYLDQYTYNEGNPNLNPEYANKLEISYLLKQKYSLSLSYTHTADVITQVLLQNEVRKSMYQTVLNLASDQVLAINLNFPLTISKWWNMNNNLLGYYKQVKAPDVNGANLNAKQFSGNFYAQNNFTISKLLTADAALNLSTPQIDGVYKIKSMFNADAGMRYNFPNKLGNLKLGVSDIFHTQRARIFSTLQGNAFNLEQWGTSTSVRLTFTYRFGKMTVKSERNRATGLDDEQKRLGGK